ncbi:MAG: hypothetical protein J7J98_04980 [candidate division Zixibacteria bacterium]|nr:hypothetical protein [candidate division Zixibacteria bacterium]
MEPFFITLSAIVTRPAKATGLMIILVLLILMLSPSSSVAFDLPSYDPWYYQSNEHGYSFAVPDKAQHYYGSALLNEFSKCLPLPGIKVMGPVISFTAGFMYEAWQDQRGIGFSQRDLFADAMGIIASQLSNKDVVLWLDYSTNEKELTFNVALKFDN